MQTGMSGNFLSCIKDVKEPLCLKREGGISLETPQWKRAYSHIEGRISWFFLSCGRKLGVPLELLRDLRDPLMLPQKSPVSIRVARCLLGFLSSRCQVLGPHLRLRLEPQASSPVLTWISGILWSFNRGFRPCLVWRHASPLSSRAVTVLSSFLSS